MIEIGDKVKVSRENENDSYDEFRDKVLEVVDVSYSIEDNTYYDESMDGMGLYELIDEDGERIPFALYEYELEYA